MNETEAEVEPLAMRIDSTNPVTQSSPKKLERIWNDQAQNEKKILGGPNSNLAKYT